MNYENNTTHNMKEKISERDHFFSKISHDLRGSFTSILGFSDIIGDPDEQLSTEEVKEFSERIGVQSRNTFELLVNFINWLKLEQFDYGLAKEQIELFDLFYEAKLNHKKRLNEKQIKLEFDISETEFVLLDYEILHSIINNLIVFLIKVCRAESKIEISAKTDFKNEKMVSVTALSSSQDKSYLENIDLKNLNNELSFPIIFTIKFTELCGGEFDLHFSPNNDLVINLKLPKDG